MNEENTIQISVAIGVALLVVVLVVLALLCGLFGLIVEVPVVESGYIPNLATLMVG